MNSDSSSVSGMAGTAYLSDPDDLLLGLEAGKVGVWRWNIATGELRWSRNLEEIHNLAAGSFDGTFSFFENDVHPDDRAAVRAALESTRREGGRYAIRYRVPQRDGSEEKWVEARGRALGEPGAVTCMVGVCQDVTEGVRLERELVRRARQQEAVADLGWDALTETDLEKMLHKAVLNVQRELSVEFVKVLELVPGDEELLLRVGVGWKPGLVGKLHIPTKDASQGGYSLSVGKPVVVADLAAETRFGTAQLLRDHGVVSGVSVIIAGPDGRAYGILGAHSRSYRKFTERDVAFLETVANVIAASIQQRLAEARQNLLIGELRHHSGNLFAQMLALFSQTARTSRSVTELTTKYEARALAFANAHKLIAEGGWRATPFRELQRTLLGPYLDRIRFNGPEVFLMAEAAFGLSSALHELAMNALKYGSLSVPTGEVEMSWSVGRSDLGPLLSLDWVEKGGPLCRKPRKLGFGSKLMKAMIERQLNGKVEQVFDPAGLKAHITVRIADEHNTKGGQAETGPVALH